MLLLISLAVTGIIFLVMTKSDVTDAGYIWIMPACLMLNMILLKKLAAYAITEILFPYSST